jgi:hypothetical protein
MRKENWTRREAFLQFNKRNIRTHAGEISNAMAEEHAQAEFKKYEAERLRLKATTPISDFDRLCRRPDN